MINQDKRVFYNFPQALPPRQQIFTANVTQISTSINAKHTNQNFISKFYTPAHRQTGVWIIMEINKLIISNILPLWTYFHRFGTYISFQPYHLFDSLSHILQPNVSAFLLQISSNDVHPLHPDPLPLWGLQCQVQWVYHLVQRFVSQPHGPGCKRVYILFQTADTFHDRMFIGGIIITHKYREKFFS